MLFCFRFNKKALNTVWFSFELRLVQNFYFSVMFAVCGKGGLYVMDRTCRLLERLVLRGLFYWGISECSEASVFLITERTDASLHFV